MQHEHFLATEPAYFQKFLGRVKKANRNAALCPPDSQIQAERETEARPRESCGELYSLSDWYKIAVGSLPACVIHSDREEVMYLRVLVGLLFAVSCFAQQIANEKLILRVNPQEGSYQFGTRAAGSRAILTARVGAQIDHQWVRSSDYPQHRAEESTFNDTLGQGHQITVTCSGLAGKPDLAYTVQLYDALPYGAVQVQVRNQGSAAVSVQAIRSVEASGRPLVDLGGPESADRVLSDSFSEDWPVLVIYDLGQGPRQMHSGAGSQLIYNRESRQSLFLGALTSNRFLTILRLGYQGSGEQATIASYAVDSTGTTEIQKDNALRGAPPEQQVELSLPLKAGESMVSERMMLAGGPDYHAQLLAYGDAIRRLHHARIAASNILGWWSWTSYYMGISEGAALTNAQWEAEHLKGLGYDFFHIDEGYQYARGEYTTPDATRFPHGVHALGDQFRTLGLTFGIWTAPFEVSNRASVYQQHKDWLVHTANGTPIMIGLSGGGSNGDQLYALDTTHPDAQEYLRQTYRILTREWGVRYIKLDFMDTAGVEGFRYRADTTALQAQRIGLEIIRETVGDSVLLDKDGSAMLNPVGIVDTGRISVDTAHRFSSTKAAGPGVAARFYMNRNFFLNDPDAYCTTAQVPIIRPRPGQAAGTPLVSLPEAEAAIVLAAVSGGMYQIGDDLPMLDAEKDRLALVVHPDLLRIAKLSRAFTPVDLMSYETPDLQPSVFFLQADARESMLAVFNWTEQPRSHTFRLDSLGLPSGHSYRATDVLDSARPVALADGAIRLEGQPPHSVRLIKLIDGAIPAAAPTIAAQVPSEAKAGEAITLSAQATGVPALSYRWDFGDGTSEVGPRLSHAFTRPADFVVRLSVEGFDGVTAQQTFPVKVAGMLTYPNLSNNTRYQETQK
jgi:alpha-galactosidase